MIFHSVLVLEVQFIYTSLAILLTLSVCLSVCLSVPLKLSLSLSLSFCLSFPLSASPSLSYTISTRSFALYLTRSLAGDKAFIKNRTGMTLYATAGQKVVKF